MVRSTGPLDVVCDDPAGVSLSPPQAATRVNTDAQVSSALSMVLPLTGFLGALPECVREFVSLLQSCQGQELRERSHIRVTYAPWVGSTQDRPTLEDVAAYAGVSRSTASRALNEETYVS